MSVLIKNMEMPKNCGECQLCHIENFNLWCCLTGREDIFYDAMPEWCPLEKPKTGKWDRLSHDTFHCISCGRTFIVMQGGDAMNFCPNCGTNMRGENE